ncbi:hypothetical protein G6F24_018699 [Rhizopus arrhizus]|nr:hypothetical protein G6F24_018699 [Rhizopus arrhizus]
MPSTPSEYEGCCGLAPRRSRPVPSDTAKSCQPDWANTHSPGLKSGWLDACTRVTVPPTMGWPTWTGSA